MSTNTTDVKSEISLLDAINFLAESWKKLAIAAVAGFALGLATWFFFGNYTAEYVLNNNNNNININIGVNGNGNINNSYALDLVLWKTIQKSLPNLASQIEEEGKTPEGQGRIYRAMATGQWWQKNVFPGYAISKSDTKDLAAISKDLDSASTTILSLTIKAEGSSKEESIQNVNNAAKFLRTGSAYLQLRNLLNSYESETVSTVADLQKRITSAEIEMGYQVQRAKSLEDLHKRFPGGNNASNQVVDPKDSGAKYLPLTTQIIAINNDIVQSNEGLQRMRERLNQIALVKIFIEQATPLVKKTFDGLALDDELLALESSLRSKLPKDDIKQQEVLDQLRSELLLIQTRFTRGLEATTAPTSKKSGMIKSAAVGLAGLLFFTLIVLLSQKVWVNIKSSGEKWS